MYYSLCIINILYIGEIPGRISAIMSLSVEGENSGVNRPNIKPGAWLGFLKAVKKNTSSQAVKNTRAQCN